MLGDYIPSNKYCLTLQYGMDGHRRQFFLSRQLVVAAIIGIVLLLLLSIGFLYSVFSLRSVRDELARTTAENEQLRAKFEVYAALIDSLFERQGISADRIKTGNFGADIMPYVEGKPRIIPFAQDPAFQQRIYEVEQKLVYLARVWSVQASALGGLEDTMPDRTETSDGVPSVYPTFGRISDGWGMRIHPYTGEWEFHQAMDFANAVGTPVYTTAAGTVTETSYDEGYGKLIKIRHTGGYETRYAHLYSFQVRVGDTVKKGQIIGLMGDTGISTGPHLHYEVLFFGSKVNPLAYLNRIDADLYTIR